MVLIFDNQILPSLKLILVHFILHESYCLTDKTKTVEIKNRTIRRSNKALLPVWV